MINANKEQQSQLLQQSTTKETDEFTQVTRRKRTPVHGNRSDSKNKKSLAGIRTPRTFEIFIDGVRADCTTEELQEHIVKELGINPISIVDVKQNQYNRSFKVKVDAMQRQSFF